MYNKKYERNDIAVFLDGDDYLLPNSLNIINNTYNNTISVGALLVMLKVYFAMKVKD